jgi:hypothetical protein
MNRLASNTGIFQPGSILTIRILELNGNRALIDFGAGRTMADIKLPVTEGEELLVKVQQSAARPNLELISSNPKSPSGDNTVVLPTPTIDLESRSIIQSDQRALDSGSSGILRKSIEFLLGDINRQQGRAVRLSDSTDPFQMFSFCLPLSQDRQPAQLKLYYPRKQKTGSKQGFQISLLLSMAHLGDLRTDLYLLDRDLSVTFFVKTQTACSKIQHYQTDLQHLLSPFFDQTVLRVVVSEKKIDDFEREDIRIENDRRVDLRI